MTRFTFAAPVLACALVLGCDDTPAPPPTLVTDRPVDPVPERPTTQELLSGPRTSISLGALPLTVRAPAGWRVNRVEGTNVVLLEGPTPAGEAAIQLSTRATTSAAALEAIVEGSQRELKENPDSMKLAVLRTAGVAKVLERQRVGKLTTAFLAEEDGTKPSPTFNWTITFFIPRQADYETYELNFIGLTADQYETDKALLREIIDSLAVDSSAGAGAITRPATAAMVPPN